MKIADLFNQVKKKKMPQLKEKIVIPLRDDVGLSVAKLEINQLIDYLISRLKSAVKSFDTTKSDIPIQSNFNNQSENPVLTKWISEDIKKSFIIIAKMLVYRLRYSGASVLSTILSFISNVVTIAANPNGLSGHMQLTVFR